MINGRISPPPIEALNIFCVVIMTAVRIVPAADSTSAAFQHHVENSVEKLRR